ncbi:Uncharacterised protein [Mycobacteroides abscessus subsp. abscessus]|nr:Uncharacterised protein [Mycobacteroides abscessus subsp. abscessus]
MGNHFCSFLFRNSKGKYVLSNPSVDGLDFPLFDGYRLHLKFFFLVSPPLASCLGRMTFPIFPAIPAGRLGAAPE